MPVAASCASHKQKTSYSNQSQKVKKFVTQAMGMTLQRPTKKRSEERFFIS